MTTFITGGTSSIGRVLIKELSHQGEEIRVLVRPNSDRRGIELPGVQFIAGDVTDVESVRRGIDGCQRVSHLAAVVAYNVPEETWWQVNREGTRKVLQAACDQGIESFVQVSSMSVLGPTQPGETADETRPVDTDRYMNLYQKTKRAGDDLAREFAAKGLRTAIVYPCIGYGCSRASSHPSLQEQTLLRMASGQPTVIMGSGKNHLTLSYYNDTVRGIQLAHAHASPGRDYILGGTVMTFPQIWTAIAQVLGRQAPTRRIPLPALKLAMGISRLLTGKSLFPPEVIEMVSYDWKFSSARAESELGWTCTPFESAIAETWKDYLAQGWQPKTKPG